jgi:hypothetical protein
MRPFIVWKSAAVGGEQFFTGRLPHGEHRPTVANPSGTPETPIQFLDDF